VFNSYTNGLKQGSLLSLLPDFELIVRKPTPPTGFQYFGCLFHVQTPKEEDL
jgi:hypothetical protein